MQLSDNAITRYEIFISIKSQCERSEKQISESRVALALVRFIKLSSVSNPHQAHSSRSLKYTSHFIKLYH